jgi:hypothetical protein
MGSEMEFLTIQFDVSRIKDWDSETRYELVKKFNAVLKKLQMDSGVHPKRDEANYT